jgi:hypothetical protein
VAEDEIPKDEIPRGEIPRDEDIPDAVVENKFTFFIIN